MTHGKNRKNFSINTADEFIADITQHIPEKSFQLVRYYGWYSNRMRGERRKIEEGDCDGEHETEAMDISKLTMIDVGEYRPRRIPPSALARVYKESMGSGSPYLSALSG